MTQKTAIIHDGDHGSDDFIATLLLAARSEPFDLLGVTTGFGNTSLDNAARNAGHALDLAGRTDIPVLKGSAAPLLMPAKLGDDAFDFNGLGGVSFGFPGRPPGGPDAVRWMAETLSAAPSPVTIAATGLMTNTARLLRDHPDVARKIGRIVAMGGCIGPLGPHRRAGNITPYAEFNFFMDPDAADLVLNSGVLVVLLPMDATHQTVFTPERQAMLRRRLPAFPASELVTMMRAAEKYDCPKFGLTGAALHDQNVPLYLLAPHLYRGRAVTVRVDTDAASERHGQLHVTDPSKGPVHMIDSIPDTDAVFSLMLDRLTALFL